MPETMNMSKVLIIGGGPVVIGQGAEFDAAAVEACGTLRSEGIEVIVVDPNPAAISTDPSVASRSYIEPLTVDSLHRIIQEESPDALIAAYGGQTALYLASEMERQGILADAGVKVLGIGAGSISRIGDPGLFVEAARAAGIPVPKSAIATSIEAGVRAMRETGMPVVIRPAFTPGGAGSGISYNIEEFVQMLDFALKMSPSRQVLLQEALLGWKQVEMIAARDAADNTSLIACIESLDPAGTHPGNSAAVLPAQTLDRPVMSDLEGVAKKVLRSFDVIGVASVKYAVGPNGDVVVLGIEPSVGRGAAFCARATGARVAEISAKLMLGVSLAEIGDTHSSPSTIAVKMPRFAFDKFPDADPELGTSMKAVGESIAIGSCFAEALQKSIRALDIGRTGLGHDAGDPWFIDSIRGLIEFERKLAGKSLVGVQADVLLEAKKLGYSDAQLAVLLETSEEQVATRRSVLGIKSSAGSVDGVCYLSYEPAKACPALEGRKIVVLAGGPDRIGQGSEFDYCVTQAVEALIGEGYSPIVVNCNPNAVSTSRANPGGLYIAPLTIEDIMDVIERERPEGVVIGFGGQTALNLGRSLGKSGVSILGTAVKSIDRIMDPRSYIDILKKLDLRQMENETASSVAEALERARKLGYPVLVRPGRLHYGRDRVIIYDAEDMAAYAEHALASSPEGAVAIYKFLEDATEVTVDAIGDGDSVIVCGVMEHIEQAGVNAGDSACSLPPHSLSGDVVTEIKRQTRALACELDIRGLLNVRFAVKGSQVFVLAVNPRAGRTIPFVSKATGVPWAKVAARVLAGKSLEDQQITADPAPKQVSVKEAVFPFVRFPGADVVLGPEMKSTGQVMGMNAEFGSAYIKAQIAADQDLPKSGTVFLSLADRDKRDLSEIGRRLKELGFNIVATRGTADGLGEAGVEAGTIYKIGDGRPDATDLIKNGDIDLIINTRSGKRPRAHEITIRGAVIARGIPIITTIAGAKATLFGMETMRTHGGSVQSLMVE